MISVIIPTYKEPEALDLCIQSAIEGQHCKDNQIIVVVDGYYEINREVIEKWQHAINVLDLPQNLGMIKATNLGVYNASHDLVLVVNDDNVFPRNWDTHLMHAYKPNSVVSPNQIEPYPSMFRQFIIQDLGKTISEFNLYKFWEFSESVSKDEFDLSGSTYPFLISKEDYLRVGGLDEGYPGPWVVDWEFFLKCEMNGMQMIRSYHAQFYHFVSLGTKTPSQATESRMKEDLCHQYFKYKWGTYAQHNPVTNSKLLTR